MRMCRRCRGRQQQRHRDGAARLERRPPAGPLRYRRRHDPAAAARKPCCALLRYGAHRSCCVGTWAMWPTDECDCTSVSS